MRFSHKEDQFLPSEIATFLYIVIIEKDHEERELMFSIFLVPISKGL